MISHELETLLRIYDRGIRFGCITADEFDELVELSREIGVTQTIDGPALLGEMIRHMEARMNEPVEDEFAQ